MRVLVTLTRVDDVHSQLPGATLARATLTLLPTQPDANCQCLVQTARGPGGATNACPRTAHPVESTNSRFTSTLKH
eukprot:5269605-Lingulodinium_polyedra.AAC.1